MPKRPIFAPGQIYHLYNRGAHRVSIFREAANYTYLLQTIKSYSRELEISVLAYVLMPNHYHLLVRQDNDTRAGALCQRVFNRYSKAYNKRYHHSAFERALAPTVRRTYDRRTDSR
jgi:REP element-mobilizing transposase RayT